MLGSRLPTAPCAAPDKLRSSAVSRVPVRGSRRVVTVRAAVNPAGSEKYDYIIVGGGTAGCVLANKLTADGNKKVLVLETGPNGDALEVAVPAGLTRLFKHPILDWGLNSHIQKQLSAREIYLARGKLLGGSSGTNATLYHRGTAADYDSWGLEGWKSKDVLDWFVSAENYEQGGSPYHGKGGTMNVEQPRYDNPLHEEFFRAAAAVGLPANKDFNDWSHPQEGYGEFQVAQKRGERADMYRMYLKPVMTRKNLKVLTGARTTKVQFEKSSQGQRAKGVEFQADGSQHTAELTAAGEVLMCAGAVHTPHILMLSGVGPAKTLAQHGIPQVANLPFVGQNLQDHPAALTAVRAKPEFEKLSITSEIYDNRNNIKPGAVLQYYLQRTGPLASTGCDHGAFVKTTAKQSQPDLQMRFVPGCALDADGINSYAIFGKLKEEGKNWPGGITMQLLAIRAKSKGSVGLKSSDPFAKPDININYFSDQQDLATLRAGVRLARKIAEAKPLQQYLVQEQFPGVKMQSDSDIDEYIRKSVHSGNALVGTCAMGNNPNQGAVVSPQDLKIHGLQGIRVVDASVIPVLPGGQTGAATVMIAERAAAVLTTGQPVSGKATAPRVPAAV